MYYYEVSPASRKYMGTTALTYHSTSKLEVGHIVVVKLKTETIRGIVIRQVTKPHFQTSPIIHNDIGKIGNPQLKLLEWVSRYYVASLGPVTNLFLPEKIQISKTPNALDDVIVTSSRSNLPPLTGQQNSIYSSIIKSNKQTHIIHGDTGTGKTRLYIELVNYFLSKNKSIILLIPEISLSTQIIEQFSALFPQALLVHSGLTQKEKSQVYSSCLNSTRTTLIVGTRSALFYPIKNIGAIIIDEFHDSAYKQEQAPRYNAVRAAGFLAHSSNAKLVLGSATPPIDEYFYAVSKSSDVHRLTEKPLNGSFQTYTKIVDLSKPKEQSSENLLSQTAITEISKTLDRGLQSIIFINRRGSSRLVTCRQCGWYALCKRCNISYTYHADRHLLICHSCGKCDRVPTECPECTNKDILFKNPGTKQIVASLQKFFPDAKIGRYDKDNKKNETFSNNHQSISSGEVDILVGTQLLTKGHDLPKLGLVCVLLAEASLSFPDYTANEKTFQLIHQVSGRVGRGHLDKTTTLIQTFNPNNDIFTYISGQSDDWIHFYNNELKQREKYNFPPYTHLLKIIIAKKSDKLSLTNAEKIIKSIGSKFSVGYEILGPSPNFIHQKNDKYYWQIIIKSKQRKMLVDIASTLPKSCTYDIDPITLL